MLMQGTVGAPANSYSPGTAANARQDNTGGMVVQENHGKLYEGTYRGNRYSIGHAAAVALSANTIALTATGTPILGVWNPTNSGKNLVIDKAALQIVVAGASAVAPGAFLWATQAGQGAISTGLSPLNRLTLANSGSIAKGFAGATALTGLSANLVPQFGSALGTLVAAQGATASPIITSTSCEEFDGSLIVPPGGILALVNTVSTTTVSVAGSLIWEEVPI